VADDDSWADVFSRVMVEKVEPNLGFGRPTILYEYPVAEAALAPPKPGDPRVAERFELYACGVELANAFGELTDAGRAAPPLRGRDGREGARSTASLSARRGFPESGLAIMPEASGSALGFDRLVMLAAGATHIDQVMWVPVRLAPS
jgi:lysyl-tRNA synthetase class 2